MFDASNSCDVTELNWVYSVGDSHAVLQYSFTRITMASDGDVTFPE